METSLPILYLIMIVVNSYWVMIARFNNGLANELGMPAGSLDVIINSANPVSSVVAMVCGWGIWVIPAYYLFQDSYILTILTLVGIFVFPSVINFVFYHPKFFAKQALKNLQSERNYQNSKQAISPDVVSMFQVLEEKLETIVDT